MKILYIVPYAPNLVRTRPYNLIRSLAKLDNQITLATVWTDSDELSGLQALSSTHIHVEAERLLRLRSYWNCLKQIPGKLPLQAVYCWLPELALRIDRLLASGSYDIVHVEHMRGVVYAERVRDRFSKIPVVWDSVDSITYLFRQAARLSRRRMSRLVTRLELSRTEKYEGILATSFDRTLVTSPIDRQMLIELSGETNAREKIEVLPNGVDLEYFSGSQSESRDPDTILLSGKMSYHANVSMAVYTARNIMPRVWQARPNTRLMIVGKDPVPEVLSLAADPRIQVTGTVPDIRPYLRKAALAIAPLTYGAGIQNKILEAMATSTPVITTRVGASSLLAEPGRDYLLAINDQDFADLIINYLADPNALLQIGVSGRQYVEKHHNWLRIAESLVNMYERVINERKHHKIAETLYAPH